MTWHVLLSQSKTQEVFFWQEFYGRRRGAALPRCGPAPRPLTCPCMDVKAAEIPANDTPVAAAEEATVSADFTQHSAEGWRREVEGKTGRSSR